jgi:hypothetical protein
VRSLKKRIRGFSIGGYFLLTIIAVVVLHGWQPPPDGTEGTPPPAIKVGGLQLPARVIGTHVAAAEGDHFVPRFWAGVNIGSTVPGTQPGEVAATRETYDRWFAGISALGANVVRIYTILSPAFYDSFRAYNLAHPEHPIYVITGIWIPEDRWYETQDAYDTQVVNDFRKEIRDIVNVIHGDAEIAPVRGHASGHYVSDISRWVLAWSLGVEWDPYAVQGTDQKYPGMPPYQGKYIQSLPGATPMESWIASMEDYVAEREALRGWSRPMSFTNWVTVDPLKHRDEPLDQEDLVSVDAAHIRATAAWPAGSFVGYHAYPYYPDFLRLQRSYQKYRRKRDGKLDAYAGYIHELRAHHKGQAIMITEFGAPSSFGLAHFGPNGRDQGAHSEQTAARIDMDLMRDLYDEGFAGGDVRVDRRVVQVHLEHHRLRASPRSSRQMAQPANQRGALRRDRRRARFPGQGYPRRSRR